MALMRLTPALLLLCACVVPISVGHHDGGPPACEGTTVAISPTLAKPNVFFAIARSVNLDLVRGALQRFLAARGTDLHVGMVPFSNSQACYGAEVSDIAITGVELDTTIPDDNLDALRAKANQVDARLASVTPNANNAAGWLLLSLRGYPALTDSVRRGFVVLIVDRIDGCGSDPVAQARELRTLGIGTAVVAVDTAAAQSDADALRLVGNAGGVIVPCVECMADGFYLGDTPQKLDAVLNSLASVMTPAPLPCDFTVDPHTDSTGAILYVGSTRTTDWSLADGRLSVTGQACAALKAGAGIQLCR